MWGIWKRLYIEKKGAGNKNRAAENSGQKEGPVVIQVTMRIYA